MTKAHISLRVSTQRQASEGVSLGNEVDEGFQEQKCRELCKLRGWEVAGVYRDAASGRTLKKRDGLAEAVEGAKATKGVVVVYALSRLGRTMPMLYKIVGELREAGANFASATEEGLDSTTMSGKMLFAMFALAAEIESDMTSSRTKAGIENIRQRTQCKRWPEGYSPCGKQPYGWTYDAEKKRRVEIPEEQAAIREARRLHRLNGRSLAKIAEELAEAGHYSRNGEAFSPEMVRRMVMRS